MATQKFFIIQAHKNPQQLKRLIDRLNDQYSLFYIHIDNKSDIESFSTLITGENIKFLNNRVDCIWGDISQIYATMLLIEEVLKDKPNEGMVILLSGQCYPLRSNEFINKFIDNHNDMNFINVCCVEQPCVWSEGRIEYYHFRPSSKRENAVLLSKINKYAIILFLKRKISLPELLILLKKRNFYLPQYGGSSWWVFNVQTLQKIYDYIQKNKSRLFRYYKYTFCVDEMFFQTIVKHLQQSDDAIKIMPNLHYISWQGSNGANPVIFTVNDLNELCFVPDTCLFARKFDIDLDSEILDYLDKMSIIVK